MKYSKKQKDEIIKRCLEQMESVAKVSRDTGISSSTIYRWVREHKKDGADERTHRYGEFKKLEHRIQHLNTIIEILKIADCPTTASKKERLAAAETLYGQYSTHAICEALDVDRGTFYNSVLRNKHDHTWYAKRKPDYNNKVTNTMISIHRTRI